MVEQADGLWMFHFRQRSAGGYISLKRWIYGEQTGLDEKLNSSP